MELKISFIIMIVVCCVYESTAEVAKEVEHETVGRQLIEQGRTLVHHAVKRFMIILPAIFFKLGIAFTLLIVVALAAVNNGFIGFLLLVVGMSSVLARLQDSRRAAAIPVQYVNPLPPYHHHQVWDRSDADSTVRNNQDTRAVYSGYSDQNLAYPQIGGYYAKYGSTKV